MIKDTAQVLCSSLLSNISKKCSGHSREDCSDLCKATIFTQTYKVEMHFSQKCPHLSTENGKKKKPTQKGQRINWISWDAVHTTVLCCSCTKPHKLTTPHRSVTSVFPLAFEITLNYSILNFLPEHLFLRPCSLEDISRKGHLYW